MRISLVLSALVALLFSAAPATASLISTVDLSDLSSEVPGHGIPTPDELDARLEFSVADSGPDLAITLTVYNDTDEAPAGEFKINEVFFNLSGISSLTAGTLNGWTMSTDACPVGGATTGISPCDDAGGAGTKADGFGIFDVALKTNGAGALTAGSSLAFTFTASGAAGTMAEAFTTELSRDSEAGGLRLSIAAAKFIEGPQVVCPGQENICDSGFGAVPEPGTTWLVGLALLGGLSLRQRGWPLR